MRSGVCGECMEDVTVAFIEDGDKLRMVELDSKADPLGRVYVDRWEQNHRVVVVMEDPEDIPAHVPLRYTLHADTCRKVRR